MDHLEVSKEFTDRQRYILEYLLRKAQPIRVYTVYMDQEQLARELGMTRQALAIHLRKLKEMGLIRTGRAFIDVTEKAIEYLYGRNNYVLILLKIEPKYRDRVYLEVRSLPAERVLRLAGDYDLAIITTEAVVQQVLDRLNNIEGIRETHTFVAIGVLKD